MCRITLFTPVGRCSFCRAYGDIRNTGAVAKAGEINGGPERAVRRWTGCRRRTPFAYQLDKEGKPAQPYGASTRVEGGGRIIVLSEGMASLFLGDPNAVRLAGDTNGTMTWWGPDSAIFMEEVLTWLSR